MSDHVGTQTSMNASSLSFNGQPQALAVPLNLSELLAQHGISADSVATAVNGQFVQREQRAATAMRPGDEVMTFQAIVGG